MGFSLLQQKRLSYQPSLPPVLRDLSRVHLSPQKERDGVLDPKLGELFPNTKERSSFVLKEGVPNRKTPLKVGALFSGGQASGGHNVIAGLFHGLKAIHQEAKLFGFLNGPSGIVRNLKRELFEKEIGQYLNQGGFDLIGTGRTKIETGDDLASALKACNEGDLDGLVIIGGDDSNTNAAILAEYFLQNGCKTQVIGVPKTIDGDLRSKDVEISFGFDTACKTYAELIGNIARDALSAKKYYHFIKLMGRSASHITLECALATHPNLALIGEEQKSLDSIVREIADLICKRAELGKEYGVILIPEGLIEFIPEMQALIRSINLEIAKQPKNPGAALENLSEGEQQLLAKLGETIQKQLLLDRDPHGNVQLSQIDTELLLIDLVKRELKLRSSYKGKFAAQGHFFGYEGRSALPSNFDANYAYSLGLLAAIGVRDQANGAICAIQNLKMTPDHWSCKLVPIVQMMHLEVRSGKEKPVIQKAQVDLKGAPFQAFVAMRKSLEIEDDYLYPGPIQFFGDVAMTDSPPRILL